MVPKDDTSSPIGKRHEHSISIQQAQDVSLLIGKRHERSISVQRAQDVSLWIPRLLARTVARAVARLPRGPHRKYDHAAITKVAEDLILIGVDDHLDWFVERVRNECGHRGIKVPQPTVLTGICKPVFLRAKGAGK